MEEKMSLEWASDPTSNTYIFWNNLSSIRGRARGVQGRDQQHEQCIILTSWAVGAVWKTVKDHFIVLTILIHLKEYSFVLVSLNFIH
jgi:hypothetical protein